MRILLTVILSISLVTAIAQGNAKPDSARAQLKTPLPVIDSNFITVDLRDLNKVYQLMGDPIKFPDGVEKTFSANDRDRLFILLNQFILEPAEKRKRPVYKPGK